MFAIAPLALVFAALGPTSQASAPSTAWHQMLIDWALDLGEETTQESGPLAQGSRQAPATLQGSLPQQLGGDLASTLPTLSGNVSRSVNAR